MIPDVEVALRAFEKCDEYDVLIGALGYECRASYIPGLLRANSGLKYVSVLQEVPGLCFDSNRSLFHEWGFVELEGDGALARKQIAIIADELEDVDNEYIRIALDVSSFTRARMAEIVLGICDLARAANRRVCADFWYAPGLFELPSDGDFITDVSEPVTPDFAGWSAKPELATSLVIGVGYEPERALGAVEYLDPAHIWCFVPVGDDPRFDRAVEKANESMWRSSPQAERIPYPVADPISTYVSLESLVYGLQRISRPIVLPFGPKIFSVCSLLIGIAYAPAVTVWRVSGGTQSGVRDCKPAGSSYCLPMSISPTKSDDTDMSFEDFGGARIVGIV